MDTDVCKAGIKLHSQIHSYSDYSTTAFVDPVPFLIHTQTNVGQQYIIYYTTLVEDRVANDT